MQFTGERFIPGIGNEELEIEHLQRYLSVQNLVQGKSVLDAASGEGYGSAILAECASSVLGVDIDETAVNEASEKYGSQRNNLEYRQSSIADLAWIPDHSLDVVVSFETIEHVEEEIQNRFLKETRRILKPDGFLIMSTPNKEVYSELHDFQNSFHVKEFQKQEFVDFLKREYSNVQIHNQYFEVASILDDGNHGAEKKEYAVFGTEAVAQSKYVVAIASNQALPSQTFSSVYINREGAYAKSIERILELQQQVEERNSHIHHLDEEIFHCGEKIVALQEEVENRGIHNIELDKHNEELGAEIRRLSGENERKDAELAESNEKNVILLTENERIVKELAQEKNRGELLEQENLREKELHRAEVEQKNQEIAACTMKNQRLTEQMGSLQAEHTKLLQREGDLLAEKEHLLQEILNRDGHIEQLLEKERAFEREKQTISYKFCKKLQKVGNVILPYESKRRFFVRIIYNLFRHPRVMLRLINFKRISHFFKYLKLEGMTGVLRRYKEAEELERSRLYPNTRKDIQVEEINSQRVDRSQYEHLYLQKQDKPLVSIVIPVYNEFEYTYNCVKSIIEHSGDVSYEVIVANDCSTDLTTSAEEIITNIRLISMKQNGRFLLNCNHAAKYARGKFILFLNNDTQVQENWLAPLVELMDADAAIGMVGSKLIYPDGSLQEAGGILWKDGSAWNYGHGREAENSEFNYVKEVDYISGAAIMIRTALWKEIGGFDERFVPAYCEDSDLAFEVRAHGYKVVYQPKSVVVHFEGVSNGTDTNSGQKAYQVVNQKTFFEKWKDVLEKEHFPNAENVFAARDRSAGKPCILVIDHYVPQYDKDAGSRTVYQYLKLFVQQGFHVKFIGDNFYRHEPYTTTLQQLGIEVLYGPYYANNWQTWIKDNAAAFQYVFLNRPHISVKYIDFIRENTNAKIIYYGHDLHFLREMRSYELSGDKGILQSSNEWKKKELSLMHKADVVYYPSQVEVDEIAGIAPEIKAKAIVAYMFHDVEEKEYSIKQREDIMFVGGFGHTPNEDGVIWFVEKVFPLVKEKLPNLKFHVLGSNPTTKVKELASEDVLIHGFVTDEELEDFYCKSRLSIVPLRYGAGIKGKVIEAMKFGIPVVTTSVGAEGILGAEKILCIEDDPKEMADRIAALYSEEKSLREMAKMSYRYIRENYSEANAWSVIADDFK